MRVSSETGATVLCVDLVTTSTWYTFGGNQLFIVADALCLPIKAGILDGVLISCLYHLVDDKRRLLSEAYRCLRWGGSLFVITLSEAQLGDRFLNRYFPSIQCLDRRRYGTIEDLNQLAQTVGFEAVEVNSIVLREETPTDEWFAVIREKRWSSLCIIPEEEYSDGLQRLERDFLHWTGSGMPSWINSRSVVWLRKRRGQARLDRRKL